MRVLACKVNDDIYKKVESLGRKSDVLREMIDFYLQHKQKTNQEMVNQQVNEKNYDDTVQYIHLEIEGLRKRLIQFLKNKDNKRLKK